MVKNSAFRYVPATAAAIAGACLLLFLASGPGYRFGVLDLRTAINFVKWSGELSMLGVLSSAAGLAVAGKLRLERKHFRMSLLALVVSLLFTINGLRLKHKAESVPPIHDITTDPADPPVFKTVPTLRGEGANSLEYGGEELAAQQRAAYPDLQPLELKLQAKEAYEKALATVKSLGWQIVGQDPEYGDIEATDTTFWFGFKDDIVVRIKPRLDGSRLDVRSASRVGISDLGKNAERIRAFLSRFDR